MTSANSVPVFADYMDGETALVHRVRLDLDDARGVLTIWPPDAEAPIVWPLSSLRLLPDQADRVSVVLAQAGGRPARLIVTNNALARRLDALCPALHRADKTPHLGRRIATLSAAAISSVLLIVFVLVPILANQLAGMLPPAGERALGDATFEQIRKALDQNSGLGISICEAPAGQAALGKILARLNGDGALDGIRLHVLDHGMINAFALPGGNIVLFRGLLKDARSAEEVAGVLGHEMGHVARRDPTRLALRSAGSVGVLGLLLGDFAGGAAVLYLSEKLISANYSRSAEAAADTYSAGLLARAKLPSAPMADFFLRLMADNGRNSGLLSHLASHPDLKGRADAARAADTVGKAYTPVLNRQQWADLKGICDKK